MLLSRITQPQGWSVRFCCMLGRIQDFKLGGAHLKKLRQSEGGGVRAGCGSAPGMCVCLIPYMVSRTKLYRLTLRLSNSWQQRVRMEKLAANDLTYRVFLPPPCCDRRNCSYNEQFNASVTPYNVVQFPVPVYIRLNKTEPRRYKWTLNWSSYLNLHFYLFCIYAH
jgi:hypothetical protein